MPVVLPPGADSATFSIGNEAYVGPGTIFNSDFMNRLDVEAAKRAIQLPRGVQELLSPIPYIIPAQMFAALLAEAKGLSPDRPRSLSKVTKTV